MERSHRVTGRMIDLNDLRVFESVATLRNFSAAARQLAMPKSSVSRSVQRLEAALGTRLFQRTTRDVLLTESGTALHEKCTDLLGQLDQVAEEVGSLLDGPRGRLRVSAGIGFGINVLGEVLPGFLARFPGIDVVLDLSSHPVALVGEGIDVAIRMGPLPDSGIVASRLGILHRYVCASPDYLAGRGTPVTFEDLRAHDLVELPGGDGRRSPWVFARGDEVVEHRQRARIVVNDALTVHKLILNGAGIGLSSGYLCAPEIMAGRLVRLFEAWTLPSVPVHAVFPSQRELSPVVRAFVDYMREHCRDGYGWQDDPLAAGS